jgi:hypothetical protein
MAMTGTALFGAELEHQDRQQHDRRAGADDAAQRSRDEANTQHERVFFHFYIPKTVKGASGTTGFTSPAISTMSA